MRVKCLAQEYDAALEPRPPDLEKNALTMRPPRLPVKPKASEKEVRVLLGQ